MSKARIIGAGTAGSLSYNTNVNLNTAGGTKKQGYPSAVPNLVNNRAINIRARGQNNNTIFTINQLTGGVRKPIRIYDGITPVAPYTYQMRSEGSPNNRLLTNDHFRHLHQVDGVVRQLRRPFTELFGLPLPVSGPVRSGGGRRPRRKKP
jgi:hypothetical protein